MPYRWLPFATCLALVHADDVLINPTRREYRDEVLRLFTPAPAAGVVVSADGVEIPAQVETIAGTRWVWVYATFAAGQRRSFTISPGTPKAVPPRVKLAREGDLYVIDNGTMAVRLPATADAGVPGPITGVRLPGGSWAGSSSWTTTRALTGFTATVIGDGTVLAKVRLRYAFAGMAGLDHDVPAFAEIDVALAPAWSHVEISERHEMSRDEHWAFTCTQGFPARQGLSRPFSAGPGSGESAQPPPPNRALKAGALPFAKPELFINLFPRWNQHWKDGWQFAASDGTNAIGAVVVRAGRWVWPHQNAIEALVTPAGDSAVLRLPTWKGARQWWLLAGPVAMAGDPPKDYIARHAFEPLDKLNHDLVLDWPGVTKGGFQGESLYDNSINPTSGIRGRGRAAIAKAGQAGDLSALTNSQVMFHPDTYGSYWNYWSPENPNFFTDFMRVPIATTAQLTTHPSFKALAARAEAVFREDLHHSVTLPGGAGQECPGYLDHALEAWRSLAPVCRQQLGFDPTTWERFAAAESFLRRISQPDGAIRRALPMGDTHPEKGVGPKLVEVPPAEVARWTSAELPGFGAILQNRPGSPQETYVAFKSGPNRGHYHGDQLALHVGFAARPLIVDHHCSYKPRAGQEHLHNRVAFATTDLPWANIDGYERLIAFKTSADADIAVGQVESDRLRAVTEKPPENWHAEYPQHALAKPITYRRTVVLMKNGPKDYLVLRDQWWAGEPLTATFCLHVKAETIAARGPAVTFADALTLHCVAPAQTAFASFPWEHANGIPEKTQGARLSVTAATGEFITVLWPGAAPPVTAIAGGVQVGNDAITFTGTLPGAGTVSVTRAGKPVLALASTDIDLDRSQGDIGLFVPDAGYPFGEIPDWLIRQRGTRPAWAR